DGKLALDTAQFTAALVDKKLGGQIQALFNGKKKKKPDGTLVDDGLVARMTKALKPYTDANGILSTKTTSLTKVQTRLASDQEALDLRIASLAEVLKAKYNKMDLLVGQLRQSS
ncbi:flagellar filament capping protein FliD, partial [Pseudomonas viridiflava]|uniref:flagellar filament capping protein FliD n=1 Tax=Pseudomonas viridiflava TaxID=33069 RepID=UPI0013DFACD7